MRAFRAHGSLAFTLLVLFNYHVKAPLIQRKVRRYAKTEDIKFDGGVP